jgi:hypothetical protein
MRPEFMPQAYKRSATTRLLASRLDLPATHRVTVRSTGKPLHLVKHGCWVRPCVEGNALPLSRLDQKRHANKKILLQNTQFATHNRVRLHIVATSPHRAGMPHFLDLRPHLGFPGSASTMPALADFGIPRVGTHSASRQALAA